MGRARVVAPPPQDYIPEPLISEPIQIIEEPSAQEWVDGELYEEIVVLAPPEPTEEELEKDRIAEQQHQEILRKKQEESDRIMREELEKIQTLEMVKTLEKQLAEQKDATEKAEKKLANEKDAAAKAREEQILKNRQQATARGKNQLNIVEARKPSVSNRIKSFLKQRRIKKATVIHNLEYGQAFIHNAGILIPKMLDDMETMHERLAILEELLVKYKQHQKK